MGRIILGHRERQVQGGLPVRAVRGQVHQLQAEWVRCRRVCRLVQSALRLAVQSRRAEPAAVLNNGVGAEEPHGLRLLFGPQERPHAHARVLKGSLAIRTWVELLRSFSVIVRNGVCF